MCVCVSVCVWLMPATNGVDHPLVSSVSPSKSSAPIAQRVGIRSLKVCKCSRVVCVCVRERERKRACLCVFVLWN